MIDDTHPLTDGVGLRPAALGDAESFAEAYTRSRAYMRRWEPVRPDTFYTVDGQVRRLTGLLADRDAGRVMPWALTDDQDRVVGAVTLASIERGPFRNAGPVYWIEDDRAGLGLATAAATRVGELARDGLGRHRMAGGTVLDNAVSQRV